MIFSWTRGFKLPRLTLFGRSLLLVTSEFLANAICWIVTGILFGRNRHTQPVLSLALLAWTLGLRHALDADHISAIDNATRNLINLGQLPVTCGLFFSLGHSTIVIVVNVAIAISSDVYNKISGVGTVGGIVGAAVSGSFLFIVGLANSIILWRIVKKRRQTKQRRAQRLANGETAAEGEDVDNDPKHNHTLMLRILGPIITFVDRPWKMYPVGVLFGFGFDTASSIALLAVSAIAKKGSDGSSIPHADIVVLPLLFTAGMTLIDSADSIIMLYSYSGFPEHSWAIFERSDSVQPQDGDRGAHLSPVSDDPDSNMKGSTHDLQRPPSPGPDLSIVAVPHLPAGIELSNSPKPINVQAQITEMDTKAVVEDRATRDLRVKMNVMSGLSIILTLMSILVAFSISLITIMGLIGQECRSCQKAANAENGGGLAGRWWRGWAHANDNSGYIGAAIVGSFVAVVGGWYGTQWVVQKMRARETRR